MIRLSILHTAHWHHASLVLVLLVTLLSPAAAQVTLIDTSEVRDVFTWEIQAPVQFHVSGNDRTPTSVALEISRYHGSKYHSRRRPNLASEETIGPMSFFRIGSAYQPTPDYPQENIGFSAWIDGARIISGGVALGGTVRYSQSEIQDQDVSVTDLEITPLIAMWPSEMLYISERIGYRIINTYVGKVGDSIMARGNSVQLRHHLAYIPSEDFGFTYAQDLTLRIGTLSEAHINNINERNYFIFSPWTDFSFAAIIGVNLDYYTETSASVLTIPIGTRIEYFLGTGMVLRGGFEYDMPTMSGQPANRLTLFGAVGYRL
jgi:hypothetical protein